MSEPRPERFFDRLSAEEQSNLRARSRPQRFTRGSQLLSERQVGDRVLVLLAGRVRISGVTAAGRDAVLGFVGPGELVGELSTIDRMPRSGAVTALEPVEALTISDVEFRGFLADHPRAAMLLLEILARRLRDADRKRIEFAAADTVGRVCSRLVELTERFGHPDGEAIVVDLPITQDELAGWCGASREATARALQTLLELGWVETRRRQLVVRDLASVSYRAG